MNTAIIAFSDAGCILAKRIARALGSGATLHTVEKYAGIYGFTAHKSVKADMEKLVYENRALVFVCACGIAVRDVAPYIKSKESDPAVVVVDDGGRYAIPILSGHIGGANRLAADIAAAIGAQAVITTATDANGRFSCDKWAAERGYALSSLKAAKEISARILTGDVPVCSEFSVEGALPDGLFYSEEGEAGIFIGVTVKEPYALTLRVIPKTVACGIGCRRGTDADTVKEAVKRAFESFGLDTAAICAVASIDVKSDEKGISAFAESVGAETCFYTASELAAAYTEGGFDESDFVLKTVGVGNVCERAAVLRGGKLRGRKFVLGGVTVAAAYDDRSVTF